MKAIVKTGLFSIVTFMYSFSALSQGDETALSFLLEAKESARSSYDNLIQDQLGIYNGPEYISYDIGVKGDPFFMADYYSEESIVYDDRLYHDIPIKYDIVQNKVLIEYFDHVGYSKELVLENEKINSFEYEGHLFIRVDDDNRIGSLKDGFYDHIFDDEIDIYVSRKKELYEKVRDVQLLKSFRNIDNYFIKMSGNIYEVKGKRSILKLYADHKNELKSFIKTNFPDFNFYYEKALISVTEQYIKLKHQNETN